MVVECGFCDKRAQLKRPRTGQAVCGNCFCSQFEEEVHRTITEYGLFREGEAVGIGASGGKDSTVLAYVLNELNKRHSYGLKLHLVSVDEGIAGYRDDSLQSVKRNEREYAIPLTVVSYKELYGWTMDDIVREIGTRNNCTFCGVFRRQALDRAALKLGVNKLVTGHNADDIAETVIMNTLRGDIARLQRSTNIVTGDEGALEEGDLVPRCKPFKFVYEKEIVLYAYHKKLDYFSTECIYSPNAYRGFARSYIKDLERADPHTILDIIYSGEHMTARMDTKMPTRVECTRCHYISSQALCKACLLLDGLNSGKPRLSLGKAHRALATAGKEECGEKASQCSGSCGCGEKNGKKMSDF